MGTINDPSKFLATPCIYTYPNATSFKQTASSGALYLFVLPHATPLGSVPPTLSESRRTYTSISKIGFVVLEYSSATESAKRSTSWVIALVRKTSCNATKEGWFEVTTGLAYEAHSNAEGKEHTERLCTPDHCTGD